MRVLGVDIGTKCGFARLSIDLPAQAWCIRLDRKGESEGFQFIRLRNKLNDIQQAHQITDVFYEKVAAHKGTRAAHLYGGYLSTLLTWCIEQNHNYMGLPVGTIKRFATGKGNANKMAMIKAAERVWGVPLIDGDDNRADALWIAACGAVEELGLSLNSLTITHERYAEECGRDCEKSKPNTAIGR
jgi:Holliday junction resolvasome RuvABC endonuclease subunit